jgi:hypothetical protein
MKKKMKNKTMEFTDLSTEAKLIVLFSQLTVSQEFHQQLTTLSNEKINWDRFLAMAMRTQLAAIIYAYERKLPLDFFPTFVRIQLKEFQLKITAFNSILFHDYKQFQKSCLEKDVLCIPLKGVYLADTLYHGESVRQISDIDVLVDEKDRTKLFEILHELGWQVKLIFYKSKYHEQFKKSHTPFIAMNGRNTIDFHHELFDFDSLYKIPFLDLKTRLREEEVFGLQTPSLSKEDQLVYLCLHAHKHWVQCNMKIASLVDIFCLIQSMGQELDAKQIEKYCNYYQAEKEVNLVLGLVKRMWFREQKSMLDSLVLNESDPLLDRFFSFALDEIPLGVLDKIKLKVFNRFIFKTKRPENWKLRIFDFFPSRAYLNRVTPKGSYAYRWFFRNFRWLKGVI